MSKRTAKQVLREEFRLKNVWLDHPHPEDFCTCQWRWPSWVFLLYRVVIFLYSLFALIYLIIVDHENRHRPNARRMHHLMVFLTTWTYIVLVLHLLIALLVAVWGAWRGRSSHGRRQIVLSESANAVGTESAGMDLDVIAVSNGGKAYSNADGGKSSEVTNNVVHSSSLEEVRVSTAGQSVDAEHSRAGSRQEGGKSLSGSGSNLVSAGGSESRRPLPWFLKISWAVWSVIASFAIIVTVIYFTALFPYLRAYYGKGISLTDLNVHALNSCFVFIDVFVSARPVRLLHVVYPMVYGTIYIVFSLIFWSSDMANNVIYPFVLDWNKPGLTVGVIIGLALVGAPLLQLFHFGLYKLRLLMYRLVYREDYHLA